MLAALEYSPYPKSALRKGCFTQDLHCPQLFPASAEMPPLSSIWGASGLLPRPRRPPQSIGDCRAESLLHWHSRHNDIAA